MKRTKTKQTVSTRFIKIVLVPHRFPHPGKRHANENAGNLILGSIHAVLNCPNRKRPSIYGNFVMGVFEPEFIWKHECVEVPNPNTKMTRKKKMKRTK